MSNPSDRPRARADAGAPSALHRILLGLAVVGLAALRNRGHDRSPVPEEAPAANAPPQGGDKRARAEAETALAPERAAEPGRGRDARAPTEIPSRGWKDILWRVYEEIDKDRIIAVAAGVTFYALLALFPAVAALVSIYGLFADGVTIQQNLKTIAVVLPGGALDMIGDQVARITAKPNATLGFAFFSGLAISLWSANAGMKAMFDALNVAYGEDEKRSFLGLNLRSLGFTLAAILFIVVALFGVVAVPVILSFIGLGTATEWVVSLARWPVLLAVTVAGLAVLYRYGPSRTEAKWRWITPGSTLAAAVWIAGSMLFSWYVANFGNYNETYGSLGAAVGFMTWIWLSTTVVLVGAELNAEIEHQTAVDSTVAAPKPLGERGARMADTVGEAKS